MSATSDFLIYTNNSNKCVSRFAQNDCMYIWHFFLQEVHIHVASTKTVLLPGQTRGYQIKHDGKDVKVTQPIVLNEDHDIYAYIESPYSQNLRFIAKKAGISILYDGQIVKIQVRQIF